MMFAEQSKGFTYRRSSKKIQDRSNTVSNLSMISQDIVAKILVSAAMICRARQISIGSLVAIKAIHSYYFLSVGKEYCQPDIRAKWTLYAASACSLSGIIPEVVRLEGDQATPVDEKLYNRQACTSATTGKDFLPAKRENISVVRYVFRERHLLVSISTAIPAKRNPHIFFRRLSHIARKSL